MPTIAKTMSLTYSQNGQIAVCHYSYAASLAAVRTFAQAIQPYSCAPISAYSFTEEETEPTNLTPASATEALEFKLIVSMRKPSNAGTVQISLPAPDPGILTAIAGAGYRLKPEAGAAISAAYSALMGQEYVFCRGWLTS